MSGSADQALNKAKRLAKRGETDTAAELYKSILKRFPGNKRAEKGLKALKIEPVKTVPGIAQPASSLDDHIIVLNNLFRLGNFQEALSLGERLATTYPGSAKVRKLIGDANISLGRFDDAIASYRTAISIKPDYAEAYNSLGNVFRSTGDKEQAAKNYSKAISIDPVYPSAHGNLSRVKKFEPGDPHIDQMLDLLQRQNFPDSHKIPLHFALGKAHEDVKEFGQSFSFYLEGNALRKKELGYDISHDRTLFSNIKQSFSRALRPVNQFAFNKDDSSKRMVFIVGVPRSGTTLVEQIIASHSKIFGGGELTTLDLAINRVIARGWKIGAPEIEEVRDIYTAGLKNFNISQPFLTDKMPLNFRWIGFIFSAFPDAKIIHVKRDARATCWSNFRTNYNRTGNQFAYSIEDLVEYYKLYTDLMAFWHSRFPGRIYDLNYERLTENQEDESRKLLNYVGVEWEDQCLKFHENQRGVKTASATQVSQKMYTGSSEAWRRYEDYLRPMIEGLEGY